MPVVGKRLGGPPKAVATPLIAEKPQGVYGLELRLLDRGDVQRTPESWNMGLGGLVLALGLGAFTLGLGARNRASVSGFDRFQTFSNWERRFQVVAGRHSLQYRRHPGPENAAEALHASHKIVRHLPLVRDSSLRGFSV